MTTFIEGSSRHMSGPNGPVTRVVIHATVSPCKKGGARATAAYFQSDNAGGLAHYVVDPGEVVQCCKEDTACWHAPPNHGSIGVELTDPQSGDPNRWHDPDHEAMLHLAASLVADICKRNNVPLVKTNAADLLNGKHGICGHDDVAQAWHQSDHSDPDHGGVFPWAHFLDLVHQAAGGKAPVPSDGGPRGPWLLPAGHVYGFDPRDRDSIHDGTDPKDRAGVAEIQREVGAHVTGHYDKATQEAVKRWVAHVNATSHRGLRNDGIVDAAVWSAMKTR